MLQSVWGFFPEKIIGKRQRDVVQGMDGTDFTESGAKNIIIPGGIRF
jgi:hypothetical protein